MIYTYHKVLALILIAFAIPYTGYSQNDLTSELSFEINRIYPFITISKEQLTNAHTIVDINSYYKPSWVKEFKSVEIMISHKGRMASAMSKNDTISQEQKVIMNMADPGTDISVIVLYIPDNDFKYKDIKEVNFTLHVDPESEALFHGGQQQLNKYIKVNAIDKISDSSFKDYDLAAVKFSINENGQVVDAHVFESSNDKDVDELLLETISNMPKWKPAEYSDGTKVKQEFVLTVGNMENCVINLLNIRQEREVNND